MIQVHLEPEEQFFRRVVERCCFCRDETRYWVTPGFGGELVACCPTCAKVAEIKDLPTKAEWCRRERVVYEGHRRTDLV